MTSCSALECAAAYMMHSVLAAHRSYELLDSTLLAAWHGDPHAVEQVPQTLQFTIAHTNSFETVIERCLDLPPSNVAPSAISALSVERLRRSFGWFSSM